MHTFSLILDGLAAGATDPTTKVLDMAGFRRCAFVAVLGAQDADATAQLDVFECDDEEGTVNVNAVAGAVNLSPINSDDKLLIVEVCQLSQRYVFATLTRGGTGDTAIGGVLGIQYEPKVQPSGVGVGCLPVVSA